MMPGCVNYSRRCVHNAPSSVQCVCMCVCVHVCVYNIINLNTCEESGDECVCVCAFIKRPTLLYMEGVWGQA